MAYAVDYRINVLRAFNGKRIILSNVFIKDVSGRCQAAYLAGAILLVRIGLCYVFCAKKIFKISLDTNSQIFLRLTCPLSCCLYHHHHCYHPHLLASFLYFRQHSNSCLSALAWFWTYTRSVSQRKVFDEHNCSRENVCSCEEDRLMIVYLRVWAEFLAKLFTKLRSGELKGIVRRLQSYACFLPFSWAVGAPCRSHKEIMKIQSLLLLFSATEKRFVARKKRAISDSDALDLSRWIKMFLFQVFQHYFLVTSCRGKPWAKLLKFGNLGAHSEQGMEDGGGPWRTCLPRNSTVLVNSVASRPCLCQLLQQLCWERLCKKITTEVD